MNITPFYRKGYADPFALLDAFLGNRWAAPATLPAFPLDVLAETDRFVARLEAPGLEREAFKVSVDDRILTIEVRSERKAEEGQATTETVRRIRLPENVAADAIEARYENGVLVLSLPKRPAAQPLQITVN